MCTTAPASTRRRCRTRPVPRARGRSWRSATAWTREKKALARDAGAAEVLDYEGFGARVRELTGGAGVAAVYDGVGRDTFDGSLESLRPHGVLVAYGQSSGKIPPLDLSRLASG